MRGAGDLSCFLFRAVIAPKIIFVERFKILPDGNHGGASGIERDRLHLVACDVRLFHGLASSARQGAHLVVVRLRGEFRIFTLAMERVVRKRGREQTPFAIYDRNANAQSSEIDSSYDRHGIWASPKKTFAYPTCAYISRSRYRLAASGTAGDTEEKSATTWCSNPFSHI